MKKIYSLLYLIIAAQITFAQNELYIQGSVFYISNGGIVQVNGSLTNTTNSNLINDGILIVTGNVTNNQLMTTANTGKLILNGTNPQSINGTLTYFANDVEINNSNASITITNELKIDGNCTFLDGIITAPNASEPFWFTTSGTYTGVADNSHVNGYVVKEGNGNFTYPVGDGVKYQKTNVNLSNNANGMQVKYFAANAGVGPFTNSGTETIALLSYNTNEYWDIKPISTATGTVTIFWDGYNDSYSNALSQRKVAHKNGANWLNEGTIGIGTISVGSVTSNIINTWSPFTLGTISTVLPLHWLNVFGNLNSTKNATINWQVQESNVQNYAIEKSTDGVNYITLISINSKGDGQNSYQFTELNKLFGIGYYRIKQTDKDGKFSYSPFIKLYNNENTSIIIYPNPTTDFVTISGVQIGSNAMLTALDGKILQQFKIGQTSAILNMRNYCNGIYFIKFENGITQKIIKQ